MLCDEQNRVLFLQKVVSIHSLCLSCGLSVSSLTFRPLFASEDIDMICQGYHYARSIYLL